MQLFPIYFTHASSGHAVVGSLCEMYVCARGNLLPWPGNGEAQGSEVAWLQVTQPVAESGFPDSGSSLSRHATFLCRCLWNPNANFLQQLQMKGSPAQWMLKFQEQN